MNKSKNLIDKLYNIDEGFEPKSGDKIDYFDKEGKKVTGKVDEIIPSNEPVILLKDGQHLNWDEKEQIWYVDNFGGVGVKGFEKFVKLIKSKNKGSIANLKQKPGW